MTVDESRTRTRVLVLATRIPLQSGDGTPSFVLDNAVALQDEFDICIFAPRVSGATAEFFHGNVRVKRFAYFPRRWERLADDAIMPQLTRSPALWLQAFTLALAMSVGAIREFRRTRFDVVHAQWIIPSGLVARLLNQVFGVPYLVTAQGADVFRLDAKPLRGLKRRVINNSTRFVAVSDDIAKHIDALTVSVEVQPSGIDFALWEGLVGRRKPEAGKVLFVGRLATKKGVADAIRAVADIAHATLVVVGDGPLREELEHLTSELGVMNRVKFLGRRSRTEIAEQMRTASCLVIPSVTAVDGDRDGTPNVLGEAIAAALPVVGSRIAGISEFLTDGATGLLFTPGNADELRDRIQALFAIRNPEVIARRARTELRGALDINEVARRYAGWYRAAVAREEQ